MPSCRWMSKQTMDHYLSLKWDELSSHKKRLKCTLLRSGYLMHDFSYTEHSGKGKTMEMTFAQTAEEANSSRGFLARWGCSIDPCCVRWATLYICLSPQECMPTREAICKPCSLGDNDMSLCGKYTVPGRTGEWRRLCMCVRLLLVTVSCKTKTDIKEK